MNMDDDSDTDNSIGYVDSGLDFSNKFPWDDEDFGILMNFPFGMVSSKEFNEATCVELHKWRKKERDLAIFNQMMKESGGIRHTVTTSKRSSGWGRSQGKYKK